MKRTTNSHFNRFWVRIWSTTKIINIIYQVRQRIGEWRRLAICDVHSSCYAVSSPQTVASSTTRTYCWRYRTYVSNNATSTSEHPDNSAPQHVERHCTWKNADYFFSGDGVMCTLRLLYGVTCHNQNFKGRWWWWFLKVFINLRQILRSGDFAFI